MSIFLICAIIAFAYFTVFYIVAAIIKNASIVDIGWGMGFVLLAIAGFIANPDITSALFLLCVTIWGLRLSHHIFRRNLGKPEDARYAAFREKWGKIYYIRAYFQLFLFQGVLMYVIALPFIFGQQGVQISSTVLFVAGGFLYLSGLVFESIADTQLKRFGKDPKNKGKIIGSGLWKYSRHPNYFGEAVIWWGIFFASLGCGAPLYTIIGPLTITLMLRFVSGVPMLERSLSKREGFEEYKKTTNAFVPWFPKSKG